MDTMPCTPWHSIYQPGRSVMRVCYRPGSLAVLAGHRRRGIGRAPLHTLEEEAVKHRYDHVFELNAQIQALGFYGQLGCQSHGEPFDETGIPHLMMIKTLI